MPSTAGRGGFIAARDPIGIRPPVPWGMTGRGAILFASEPKTWWACVGKILPFPPGHYYKGGKLHRYRDITQVRQVRYDDLDTICRKHP